MRLVARACEECGATFVPASSRDKGRFCSRPCHYQHNTTTIDAAFLRKMSLLDPLSGCWIWQGLIPRSHGYAIFSGRRVNRLSYQVFHGPISANIFVLHECDNPACINPDHLYAGDHQRNMQDRTDRGRNLVGDRHPRARLTAGDIPHIRAAVAAGRTQRGVAAEFGVAQSQIWSVCSGRTWAHVP